MNTPQQGLRPTQQELMEFVDGTLLPQRFHEIETMAEQSQTLQHEIALMKALRKAVLANATISPSRKFTANVMNEILPGKQVSFWYRMAKNSSNLFAMVLVLSMIGIVLVTGPGGSKHEANLITKSIESYSNTYNAVSGYFSTWFNQFSRPVTNVTTTASGKIFILGIAAFLLFMAVDELFGKKYSRARLKH